MGPGPTRCRSGKLDECFYTRQAQKVKPAAQPKRPRDLRGWGSPGNSHYPDAREAPGTTAPELRSYEPWSLRYSS